MRQKFERKHAYTLIEIVVTLSLILLVTAGVGININKALKQRRFATTKEKITNTLSLAHHLAKLTASDATVVIEKKTDGYVIFLEAAKIPARYAAIFKIPEKLDLVDSIKLLDDDES